MNHNEKCTPLISEIEFGKLGKPETGINANYSSFAVIFLLLFSLIFTKVTQFSSSGDLLKMQHEQWINLTSDVFTGSQDFLFSFGPLFWLVQSIRELQFSEPVFWVSALFKSGIYALAWTLLIHTCLKTRSILYFSAIYFLFFRQLDFNGIFLLWPLCFIAFLEFGESPKKSLQDRTLVMLGLFTGLLFYVRFLFGFVPFVAFSAYAISRIIYERRKPREIGILWASVILAYVITGLLIFRDGASIIDYLKINLQLSSANSVDMVLDVRNEKKKLAALFVVASMAGFLLFKNRVLLPPTAAVLAVLFKLGLSREDHSFKYFVVPCAAISLLLVFQPGKTGRVLFLFISAALFAISTKFSGTNSPVNSFRPAPDFSENYTERRKNLYKTFRLSDEIIQTAGDQTVDVYPFNNEYLFASGLKYYHRPLFQNFMTLSPGLDALNKEFFESKNRPKFVLWHPVNSDNTQGVDSLKNLDDKYVLNEDPLTSSSILLNYHPVAKMPSKQGASIILFQENSEYTGYRKTTISKQSMTFGQWYDVPKTTGGVIKVIPNFELTLAARLKNLFFRGEVLKIFYKTEDGIVHKYRLNILNSMSGVWVSPLLEAIESGGDSVIAILFEASQSKNYFNPVFEAEWINIPGLIPAGGLLPKN